MVNDLEPGERAILLDVLADEWRRLDKERGRTVDRQEHDRLLERQQAIERIQARYRR